MTYIGLSETTFLAGVTSLGLFCLGAGFTTSQIPLLLLRAFAGITAALTIPSALKLLVNVFPKRDEQALAIALFGGTGALGTYAVDLYLKVSV
jgi:MFS family permease